MSESETYKIVVLGEGGVGKSALTLRVINDTFSTQYDPTIEETYRKKATVDGQEALMDILDTAAQEEFSCMNEDWMWKGDGFIIVYSIISSVTFEKCEKIRENMIKIRKARDENSIPPIVLVGNKCDLDARRQVQKSEAEQLALKWKCGFMETSAKERINTHECFHEVVRRIRGGGTNPIQKITEEPKSNECKCVIL